MEYASERKELAHFMRRLYKRGLTTTSGGNVSLRCNNRMLITPSQTDKGNIRAAEIGILGMDGENLTPQHTPSMESKMHLAVYHANPRIQAIVHAHPTTATSFCISHKEINTRLAGESWAIVGSPVRAPYAIMGSLQLAKHVASASLKGHVILMENHGVLATGENLLQAFDRLEVTEAAAKMTLITQLLGEFNELGSEEIKAIDALFQ